MPHDESRWIGRREALGVLSAGALAARKPAAEEEALNFRALDHVEFFVSGVPSRRAEAAD